MKIIANYLRHLEEDAFCDSQLPGWERYLMSRSWKFYDKAALTGATIAWIVAIGSSTWGAWYFSSQPKVTVESVSPPLGSSQGRSAVSPTGGTPQPVVPPSGDRSAQNPNGQGEGN